MKLKRHKYGKRFFYKLLFNEDEIASYGLKDEGKILFEWGDNIDKHLVYELKQSDFQFPIEFCVLDDNIFKELNISLFRIDYDKYLKLEFSVFARDIFNQRKAYPLEFMSALKETIGIYDEFEIIESKFDSEYRYDLIDNLDDMTLSFKTCKPFEIAIKDHLKALKRTLINIVNIANNNINEFKWEKGYELNESLFTQEVLLPLFRKMKFDNISFVHGTREFGRDIIFSEINKFGGINLYGVQVKAGNISGKANSTIDTIIGQINDAFQMPYTSLDSKSEQYISTLVIAISGYYSDNAKSKIMHKIPKGICGSLLFFDKDKILELISKYW